MRLVTRSLLGVTLAAFPILPAGAASPPWPLGPDFVISEVAEEAFRPSIGANADGVAVVVWTSSTKAAPEVRIYARIYAADGTPASDPMVVAEGPQLDDPSVAVAGDGSFVVGWRGEDSDDDGFLARRFAAGGSPLGAAFVVNQVETARQIWPRLAAVPGGGFVAVWSAAPTPSGAIHGRLFDAGGQPLTGDTTLATSASPLLAPDLVHLDGGFAATWQRGAGGSVSIVAQRLDGSLVPVGAENVVSSQLAPLVAAAPDGGDPFFAVVSFGLTTGVSLGRFDEDGQVGGYDNVSDSLTQQSWPSIAFDAAGNLVAAWVDSTTPGSRIRGRLLDGRPPFGPPSASIVINTTEGFVSGKTALASFPDGRVLAAWYSEDVIRGRFLSSLMIFADGFESGGTAAWN